ncbi:MAG: hypothetical protein QOJ98_3211, partial [Acidobacteriota bacterium]|nr:hypothetical protein [Acidobacteriota bacterium]
MVKRLLFVLLLLFAAAHAPAQQKV